MKRAKLYQDKKIEKQSIAEQPNTIQGLANLATVAKEIDPDLLNELIEKFTGGGEVESGKGFSEYLPLIQGFVKGMQDKQKQPDNDKPDVYFY